MLINTKKHQITLEMRARSIEARVHQQSPAYNSVTGFLWS